MADNKTGLVRRNISIGEREDQIVKEEADRLGLGDWSTGNRYIINDWHRRVYGERPAEQPEPAAAA